MRLIPELQLCADGDNTNESSAGPCGLSVYRHNHLLKYDTQV